MTENYGTVEITKRIVTQTVQGIGYDLEILTKRLDRNFPSIEAGKMKEYQQILDAVERYELAVQDKIDSLNKEAVEQR